jgi:hypothetical protein
MEVDRVDFYAPDPAAVTAPGRTTTGGADD